MTIFFTETGQNRQLTQKTPFFRKKFISQSALWRTTLKYTPFEADLKVTQENCCEGRAKPVNFFINFLIRKIFEIFPQMVKKKNIFYIS